MSARINPDALKLAADKATLLQKKLNAWCQWEQCPPAEPCESMPDFETDCRALLREIVPIIHEGVETAGDGSDSGEQRP